MTLPTYLYGVVCGCRKYFCKTLTFLPRPHCVLSIEVASLWGLALTDKDEVSSVPRARVVCFILFDRLLILGIQESCYVLVIWSVTLTYSHGLVLIFSVLLASDIIILSDLFWWSGWCSFSKLLLLPRFCLKTRKHPWEDIALPFPTSLYSRVSLEHWFFFPQIAFTLKVNFVVFWILLYLWPLHTLSGFITNVSFKT